MRKLDVVHKWKEGIHFSRHVIQYGTLWKFCQTVQASIHKGQTLLSKTFTSLSLSTEAGTEMSSCSEKKLL